MSACSSYTPTLVRACHSGPKTSTIWSKTWSVSSGDRPGTTLPILQILENKKLSEAEKAQQLQQLFKQLPQDWQENLEQLNTLQDLRSLTAAIKARGGSAAEIRQMRLNLVGPEATQRLEQLDGQRSQWKSRVEDYLSARDQIMQSGMNDPGHVS